MTRDGCVHIARSAERFLDNSLNHFLSLSDVCLGKVENPGTEIDSGDVCLSIA